MIGCGLAGLGGGLLVAMTLFRPAGLLGTVASPATPGCGLATCPRGCSGGWTWPGPWP